jgi:selenide,water dikinase
MLKVTVGIMEMIKQINWQKNLLTDPQTSGGLLVACSPEVEQEVLDLFIQDGFTQAKKVGIFEPGSGVTVL